MSSYHGRKTEQDHKKSPVLSVLKRLKDSGLTFDDQVQRGWASPRMAFNLPKDRVKALKERKESSRRRVTVAASCARWPDGLASRSVAISVTVFSRVKFSAVFSDAGGGELLENCELKIAESLNRLWTQNRWKVPPTQIKRSRPNIFHKYIWKSKLFFFLTI